MSEILKYSEYIPDWNQLMINEDSLESHISFFEVSEMGYYWNFGKHCNRAWTDTGIHVLFF